MNNRVFVSRNCPSSEEWQALLSMDLPATRIAEMEVHLEGCPVCVAVLDTLTPSLPEDLWDAARAPVSSSPEGADHCRNWAEVPSPKETTEEGPLPFERTGDYKSEGRIGCGGMGEVYRAWEFALERHVAIKILPSRTRRSPAAIARLKEEALRLASLEHENIVRVYAADEQDAVPFFAMELVTGSTLAQANCEDRFQPRRAAELVRMVATAVHYAHTAGVFHLDLKPSNILLTVGGIPKVGDFGLARTLDGSSAQPASRGAGTVEYMAPEQWMGDPASLRERTDVYGLGTILYELLTGRPPFSRSTDRNEMRRRVVFDEPTPPRALNKKVPRDLEVACLRCLRKRPEDRYETAQALAKALARFRDGYPIADCSWPTRMVYLLGRHRSLAGAVSAGLLLVISVLSLLMWQKQRTEAKDEFASGQRWTAEGRITEGYDRMRKSIGLLPFGETVLRGYFSRSVAAWEATLSREVARLNHSREILSAVTSPDGRYVLLGDASGATILWDLSDNTTRALPTPRGRAAITAVAFNKTGTLCASGGYDHDITVWDVSSNRVLWGCSIEYYVRCLGFAGDGNKLLTGTASPTDSPLRMWEMHLGNARELRLETEGVRPEAIDDIIVSPRGDRFISVASTNRCLLWNAENGRVIADLSEEAGLAPSQGQPSRPRAAFSVDGSRLAIAGTRLTLRDGRTGALTQRVDAGRWQRVHSVGFRDDGVTLAVDTERGTVLRRGTLDMSVWEDVPIDHPTNPSDIVSFAGRGLVLTGLNTKTLRLLKPPPLALPHANLVDDIARAEVVVSGDAFRIATLTRPRWIPTPERTIPTIDELNKLHTSRLQVWDARTLRLLGQIAEFPEGHVAASIAYGPTADTLAVGCQPSDDQAPVLLGTLSKDGLISFVRLGSHRNTVRKLAFNPDGTRLITGSGGLPGGAPAELICWSLEGRTGSLWSMPHPAAVTAMAVSPSDGSCIAVGGLDGVLRLLRIDRPFETSNAIDTGGQITAVAFSSDGSLVAVAHVSRVCMFEVSGTSVARRIQFDQPGSAISAVAFDPTGNSLYVKDDEHDGRIQRWDVHFGQPIAPIISFVDGLMSFNLIPRPEAVIAVTNKGKLIVRTVN